MLKNVNDTGWIVPKLLLATYALVIVAGVIGILQLL